MVAAPAEKCPIGKGGRKKHKKNAGQPTYVKKEERGGGERRPADRCRWGEMHRPGAPSKKVRKRERQEDEAQNGRRPSEKRDLTGVSPLSQVTEISTEGSLAPAFSWEYGKSREKGHERRGEKRMTSMTA